MHQTEVSNDVAYSSEDLLDIENDVRSFALLLASNRVKPPLAIALFGNWGSGKSFFMRYLQLKIDELSRHQGFLVKASEAERSLSEQDQFCRGIAQIEFNAWSYLDSNLWAGLASSIFEKLNEYISESTKSGIAKLQVQTKLKKRIRYLQNQKTNADSRRGELQELKSAYEKEKLSLERSLESEFRKRILRQIGSSQLTKLYEDISEDQHLAQLSQELNLTQLKRDAKWFNVFWRNLRNGQKLLPFFLASIISIGIACLALYYLNEWYLYLASVFPIGIYFQR